MTWMARRAGLLVMSLGLTLPSLGAAGPMLGKIAPAPPQPAPTLARATPIVSQPPGPPAPTLTVRPVVWGVGFGAVLGGLAMMQVGSSICADHENYGGGEYCGGRALSTVGGFALGGALVGALLGAVVGAAIPSHPPVGQVVQPRQQRSDGETAQLSLQVGTTTLLGEGHAELASSAVRAGLLLQLGPHVALGPELGQYQLQKRQGTPAYVLDNQTRYLAAVIRVGTPVGRLWPYLGAGLGVYDRLYSEVGGSLALGLDWRFVPPLSASIEARLTSDVTSPGTDPVGNLTAGAAWHW